MTTTRTRKSPVPEVTQDSLVKQRQGWKAVILTDVVAPEATSGPPQYRARITVNMDTSYPDQSTYKIEAWWNMRWSEVWTLDPRAFSTPQHRPGYEQDCLRFAQERVRDLYRCAEAVLF